MKIMLVDANLVRTFLVIIFLILVMTRTLKNNYFLCLLNQDIYGRPFVKISQQTIWFIQFLLLYVSINVFQRKNISQFSFCLYHHCITTQHPIVCTPTPQPPKHLSNIFSGKMLMFMQKGTTNNIVLNKVQTTGKSKLSYDEQKKQSFIPLTISAHCCHYQETSLLTS